MTGPCIQAIKALVLLIMALLTIGSNTKQGASRYISIPSQSQEFALEAIVNIEQLKPGEKAGLIYGFKDWQNYTLFKASTSFYIGFVYEGVGAIKAEGMFSGDIKEKTSNNIKILSNSEKNFIYQRVNSIYLR